MELTIKPTGLPGLLLVEPRCISDARGHFFESFRESRYAEAGIPDRFVQDNVSRSARGILRGLHYQIRRSQAQLVTVIHGRIFDVAVDLRPSSSTFGRWFGVELDDSGSRQLYMAPGFAHGFCVLSDMADVHYKVSRYYDHGDEGGLLWCDPDIGIQWPVQSPSVSPRDGAYLKDLTRDRLPHDPPIEL